MKIEEAYSQLFGFSKQSYFNWLKEHRRVILFFKKYFMKEQVEEIEENGHSKKMEKLLFFYEVTKNVFAKNIIQLNDEFLEDFYIAAECCFKKKSNLVPLQVAAGVFNGKTQKQELIINLNIKDSAEVLCELDAIVIELLYSFAIHSDDSNKFKESVRKM